MQINSKNTKKTSDITKKNKRVFSKGFKILSVFKIMLNNFYNLKILFIFAVNIIIGFTNENNKIYL